MANAFIGIPLDYNVSASIGTLVNNLKNDEPGLVYSGATGGYIDFDVTETDPIQALCVLGVPTSGVNLEWRAYVSSGARTSGSYTWTSGVVNASFSTYRTAEEGKHVTYISSPRSERYWRLYVSGSGTFQPWRALLCKVLMPETNIEVKAQGGIDDRSDRRYTRSGRRVIDPTIICPTFKGTWPWLSKQEMQEDFRPLMQKMGGTHPVLFCLDHEDDEWGEDATIFGDLEKQQSMDYDDGQLYGYTFTIVAIAP